MLYVEVEFNIDTVPKIPNKMVANNALVIMLTLNNVAQFFVRKIACGQIGNNGPLALTVAMESNKEIELWSQNNLGDYHVLGPQQKHKIVIHVDPQLYLKALQLQFQIMDLQLRLRAPQLQILCLKAQVQMRSKLIQALIYIPGLTMYFWLVLLDFYHYC